MPTGVPPAILLPEGEAQAVLCARAIEEVDSGGAWIGQAERRQATDAARADSSSSFDDFLVRRAVLLIDALDRKSPGLARLRRASSLRLTTLWILVPALLIGTASNLLGPHKHINVVANPLAGLLLWNLLVYGLILGARLRGLLRGSKPGAESSRSGVIGLASTLFTWPARDWTRGAESAQRARATMGYLEGWNRCARSLLGARLRHALHLGAMAMVLGALGGLYARGLLLEYRVTWESTFLGPEQVETWFAFLFGPAAWLTGLERPGLEALEAIRMPHSGDAAPWIHLYALSTLLIVVLPRLLLATAAGLEARRLARALPVDTGARYFRRLAADARGDGARAEVTPYSYTPTAARLDRLKSLLFDLLGARANIHVGSALEYGAGYPTSAAAEGADDPCRVLLFNLAQTPESEVHGRLLEELRREARGGGSGLVLVDAAAWRERAGEAGPIESRLEERRRTWDRIAREAGLEAIHLDLDRAPTEDLACRMERALTPVAERKVEA